MFAVRKKVAETEETARSMREGNASFQGQVQKKLVTFELGVRDEESTRETQVRWRSLRMRGRWVWVHAQAGLPPGVMHNSRGGKAHASQEGTSSLSFSSIFALQFFRYRLHISSRR